MEFVNKTEYQADFICGPAGETSVGIAVIGKGTYEIIEDALVQVKENAWPIHFKEFETPYGKFPSEYQPFRKPRADLIILGFAYSNDPDMGRSVNVNISVSDFKYTIKVFGDRIWEKQGDILIPSIPLPFKKIPLTLENAFGGYVENEFGTLKYPYNAAGKGYYLTTEQALGSPLPNLESPEEPIKTFEQKPKPIAPCVYPVDEGLRIVSLGELNNPESKMADIAHLIYCWAHPDLMIDSELNPGDRIVVEGIRPEGVFEAAVMKFDGLVTVNFDKQTWIINMKLDTIIIIGEENRIVFRWWGSGVFPIEPRQKRIVKLLPQQ